MSTRIVFMPLIALVFLMAGCSAKEEMVNLRLYDMPSDKEQIGAGLVVAVESFEDLRSDKDSVGTRTYRTGSQTYYNFMGGNLETGASEAFIAFLNSRGFQASKAGTGSPDVTIRAVVRKFVAEAVSSFMNTHIEAHAITEFHITNHSDNSRVRLTIGSGGTDDEFIFDQEDIEDLVNIALQESFEEFLENLAIQDKTLRKKI